MHVQLVVFDMANAASEVLRWFRMRGVRIAVATELPRSTCDAMVQKLGLGALVDAIVTRDEVAESPEDLIQLAMKRTRVTNPRCVVKVGDRPSDVEEGRRAGCGMVIGVTQGTHAEQLAKEGPDHLVPTVESLPDLFFRLSRERAGQRHAHAGV